MEDFEKLRDSYEKYLPPSDLWDKIETDLDYDASIKPLLSNLPVYKVPDEVWSNIESTLQNKKSIGFKYFKFLKQTAAAIILLAMGFGLGRWFEFNSENANVKSSTNNMAVSNEKQDQYMMESVLNRYSQVCKFYPENNPCSLVTDLSDLELAKMELNNIIRKMGNSDNIERQLRRIELEKSRIIRNMAQRI